MMPVISQHIPDGASSLAARGENMRVIAIGEHGSMPPRKRVEPLRQSDGKALHAAREGFSALHLDDEVEMVALDGEMDDPHAVQLARDAQDFADELGTAPGAQVPDAGHDSHRDVH